ncbi:MAG: FtsQ-type POTRA domain-containing protein [Candidatus Desantisbacteria bacterium]
MSRHKGLANKLSIGKDKWRSKKGRKKIAKNFIQRIRRISFWVIIGVICALIIQTPSYLMGSPHFFIDSTVVTVRGGQITKEEIQNRLEKFFLKKYATMHPNIFRVNVKEATKNIALYPRVLRVTLKRQLPKKILIDVEGRTPKMMLKVASQYYGIDEYKIIFPIQYNKNLTLLSGISNIEIGKTIPQQGIEDVFLLYHTIAVIDKNLSSNIFMINIANPRNVVLMINKENPVAVYCGSRLEEKSLVQKLNELKIILEYFKKTNQQREYIDIRFDNIIIK